MAKAQEDYDTALKAYTEAEKANSKDDKLPTLAITRDTKRAIRDALQKVDDGTKDVTKAEAAVTTAADDNTKRAAQVGVDQAKERLTKAKDDAARMESVGSIRTERELELKAAWKDIYKYEAAEREASDAKDDAQLKTAHSNLEAAKERWQIADRALQAIGTKDSVLSLEADGIQTMKIAIKGHLNSLDSDINAAQAQLGSTSAGLANAPNAIIGVAGDKALIRASDDASAQSGSATVALGEESADVWTKIAFTVGSESSSSSTRESNISGSANLEVGRWWARVKASSSFSSSSKKVESTMSSCRVEGSFSAMVVNIKRPWLHSDLFQDFDIDISENTKLSPGAEQIKTWVDKGDTETGPDRRTDYGKFPAYPTAFIVAADTVLEVCDTHLRSP